MPSADCVTLVSKGGDRIDIPLDSIQGHILQNIVETGSESGDFVPVELIRYETDEIQKIKEFLVMHKADPMVPVRDPREGTLEVTFAENVPQEQYREFVESMERSLFWKVRSLANFLGMDQLVLLVNVWLTFFLKDKTVDEIHEILHIPKMTPEQEAQARTEHPWLFEDPDAIVDQETDQ